MSIEVGLLIAICTFIMGYFTFQRNKEKDVKHDVTNSTREMTLMGAKLDNMNAGIQDTRSDVKDIKFDLKALDKTVVGLSERVAVVEESAKQAHKRIDTIEKDDK